MYTQYFGFREEPFADIADLRFFYPNSLCQKAHATLLSGIREQKGFLLLTGEAGTGKTTILRRVMKDLEASSHSLFFDSTSLTCTSIDDLLYFICTQLEMQESGGKAEKLHAFRGYLNLLASKGGTGVLMVDEAHHLSEDVLSGLRMIAPLDPQTERLLLQIILVGPPELEDKLEQPKLRPILQRIALRCHVERFRDQEIAHYISHRLAVVGCERQDLFSSDAVNHIAEFSKGLPRLINIICDNALFLTHSKLQQTVSAEIIEEVVANLRILAPSTPHEQSARPAEMSPPTVVTITPHLNGRAATIAVPHDSRALAPEVRQAFSTARLRFRGYWPLAFFLTVMLGLLVYGRQESSPPRLHAPARERSALDARRSVGSTAESRLPIITSVLPKGYTLVGQVGQAQPFAVEVQEVGKDETMEIVWLLDGQRVAAGPSWIFTPPVAAGERRYIVTVAVTNARGRKVERQWTLTATRTIVPAPRIIAAQPAGQEIRIAERQKVSFTVEVSPPSENLRYLWLLDGQEQGQDATWTYDARFTTGQQQTVTVQVRNLHNQVVERSWKIYVRKMDLPPMIVSATPTSQVFVLTIGGKQDFSVTVTSSDPNDSLTTVWLLDGQVVARDQSWTLAPPLTEAPAKHRVAVTVSDKKGRTVEKQWIVTVGTVAE